MAKSRIALLGLLATVGVAAGLLLVVAEPARAAFPGENGKIAFVRDNDIHYMNDDGYGQVRLTDDPAIDSEPAWSPDGESIVFTSDRDGNFDIYVMDADGRNQTRLTDDEADDTDPTWSPDGRSIGFERDGDIYTMNGDGSDQSRLTDDSANDKEPAWSPDGRRMAFSSNRDGCGSADTGKPDDIYTVGVDGSDLRRVTDHSSEFDCYYNYNGSSDPTWSPDGTKIAFEEATAYYGSHSNSRIRIVDAEGLGEPKSLPSGGGRFNESPTWSSDGTKVAWNDYGCGGAFQLCGSNEIYVVNVDGSGQAVNLTESYGVAESFPSWGSSPNSPPLPDTESPDTVIWYQYPRGDSTSRRSMSFYYYSSEGRSTFECSLDDAPFTDCERDKAYGGLADGEHTFQVRAKDAAGNVDPTPASRTWTVDTTAPEAPTIAAPADGSYDNDGTFVVSGTAEKGSNVELLEGDTSRGTTKANGSGNWSVTLSGVPEGPHTYTAKATDDAGNASAASDGITVTVDKTAPRVTSKGPTGRNVSRRAFVRVGFSEAMDPGTLTTRTVRLVKKGEAGRPVAATVSYDPANNRAILDPKRDLASGASYTATVTTGAKDQAGNALAEEKTWSFKIR